MHIPCVRESTKADDQIKNAQVKDAKEKERKKNAVDWYILPIICIFLYMHYTYVVYARRKLHKGRNGGAEEKERREIGEKHETHTYKAPNIQSYSMYNFCCFFPFCTKRAGVTGCIIFRNVRLY